MPSHKVDIKHAPKEMPPATFYGTDSEPRVDRFPSSTSKEQMFINSVPLERLIILVITIFLGDIYHPLQESQRYRFVSGAVLLDSSVQPREGLGKCEPSFLHTVLCYLLLRLSDKGILSK